VPVALEHFRSLAVQGGEIKEYEPLPWVDVPAVAWNFVNREPIGVCAQIHPLELPPGHGLLEAGPCAGSPATR